MIVAVHTAYILNSSSFKTYELSSAYCAKRYRTSRPVTDSDTSTLSCIEQTPNSEFQIDEIPKRDVPHLVRVNHVLTIQTCQRIFQNRLQGKERPPPDRCLSTVLKIERTALFLCRKQTQTWILPLYHSRTSFKENCKHFKSKMIRNDLWNRFSGNA